MNDQFFKKLQQGLIKGNLPIKGYSDEEIQIISEKYNINIRGHLKGFLSEMGRSDGGLIGEGYIHLYKPHWGITIHLSFQRDFVIKLQAAGLEEYADKPFVFSWWEERFYYFLRTGADDDHVYQYDDDEQDVVKVGEDLLDFLRYAAEGNKGRLRPVFEGDLLSDESPLIE